MACSHIDVVPPSSFDMDEIVHTKYYTYFDSTGRPAVVFHKANVISDHERPLFVSKCRPTPVAFILICMYPLDFLRVFCRSIVTKACSCLYRLLFGILTQHSCFQSSLEDWP